MGGSRIAGVSIDPYLRTERLLLRRWRPQDRGPFAAMNADPEVMEHFPATLSRAQSATMIERIEARFEHHGYGLWALEIPRQEPFIGFARRGLSEIVSFTAARNRRSRRVMERLGMRWDPAEDFDHPLLREDERLRRHVLYRLQLADWRGATIGSPRGSSAHAD
jgi:ribosomal-protein-alanine N-acetyltransferase